MTFFTPGAYLGEFLVILVPDDGAPGTTSKAAPAHVAPKRAAQATAYPRHNEECQQ